MDTNTALYQDIQRLLLTREQIGARIEELGAIITKDYAGKRPVLVSILKGAVVFFSDLIRWIDLPLEIDFMAISSYGSGTRSSGVVRINKDLDRTIEGRDVLIVEDIVDSGLTLSYLKQTLSSRNPSSLRVITLLDKPSRRSVEFTPDYCGFSIEDYFVVGYGLDYNNLYRNLPDIGVLKPEIYGK